MIVADGLLAHVKAARARGDSETAELYTAAWLRLREEPNAAMAQAHYGAELRRLEARRQAAELAATPLDQRC